MADMRFGGGWVAFCVVMIGAQHFHSIALSTFNMIIIIYTIHYENESHVIVETAVENMTVNINVNLKENMKIVKWQTT